MIETAELTNRGGKTENEDTFRVIKKRKDLCVVVADGLGGHGGGQIASSVAADSILKCYHKKNLETREGILESVKAADLMVKQHQTPECEMKTTLVALVIDREKKASWFHVGDSRLYHFVDSKIVQQTMDHSVSQMAVLMGEITPEQIRFNEDRCKVLRALGSDNAEPDIVEDVSVEEQFHAFLLATDGFWEYIDEQEMEALLAQSSTPGAWLSQMSEMLSERVGEDNDNFTAVAVFVCR